MNESAAAPPLSSSGETPTYPFYQSQLLRVFESLTEGRLRLELPDGSAREFGQTGSAVNARITVLNPVFFQKCVLYGDIGFGESYVDGDWETDSIERVIAWAIANVNRLPSMSGSTARSLFFNILKGYNRIQHRLRPNSVAISRRNIADHYDLGNEFYRLWLDPSLTYSSARYTLPGQSLESAQFSKYDALCQKLRLQSTDHVLEIGTGWGGFSLHAAKHYGCRVTTTTISKAQFELARQRFEEAGLSNRIEPLLEDYRHLSGSFDKIVSIEMMEALGDRYLKAYLVKLNHLLKRDGLIGLQFITAPDNRHAQLRRGVDWIQKHIFPGSLLLSLNRINEIFRRTSDLTLHELEDLGASYAKTLHVWWERFNARLDAVGALGFDGRFIRKWNYYLQYCEAAFASRNISVVQAIYTRPNNPVLHTAF